MEENKQILEFIEPEVKVVTIAPQSRILQESKEVDIDAYRVYRFEDIIPE